MDLFLFIKGWFYYSFYYMALSVFATLMLNKVTKRLWLSPLIINAVSIAILLVLVYTSAISVSGASQEMYFTYMPIVFSSAITNVVLYLSKEIKNKLYSNKIS